ncbi:MAG: TylF/MycF/NovP-related O-methyltransferase [Vicinamibacteria bacterium]|jgi:O-methyltransferase
MAIDETTAREIRAPGPGPGSDELRAGYLGLLKLALCDLAGANTQTAYLSYDKTVVFSRPPSEEEIRFRAVGKDWPLHGLTMTGLTRLDDLQACVESVVADGVAGDLIEAGVWRGGASMLMRATLDTLGEAERCVWLADSFQGFPVPDPEGFPADVGLDLSPHEFLSVSVEEVRSYFARLGLDHDLRFVPGFFHETMPRLRGGRWAIARLDGDTYESTWVSLEALYPGLAQGGYLIVDDYGFVPACREAVNDYRREHAIAEPIVEVDWNCVRWRRESVPAVTAEGPPEVPAPTSGTRSTPRSGSSRVATERELELERELAELRGVAVDAERGRG